MKTRELSDLSNSQIYRIRSLPKGNGEIQLGQKSVQRFKIVHSEFNKIILILIQYEDKRIEKWVQKPDLSDKDFTERKWEDQVNTEEWSEIQASMFNVFGCRNSLSFIGILMDRAFSWRHL